MSPARRQKPLPAGPHGAIRSVFATRRLPGIILIVAVLLRLWNTGWGLPHLYEEAIPLRFAMKLWPGLPSSIDNHFFIYPAFSYYLHLLMQFFHFCGGYIPGAYESLPAFIALFDVNPSTFTLVARCTTILFDAGIIVMSYLALERYFDRESATIAAALICLNVLHIRQSHLINVDTLLAFFSVTTFYCLCRLSEKPSMGWYTAAGISIGLAAASKYNGGILLVALIAAHVLAAGSFRESFRPDRLRGLIAGGATAAAVFCVCNPLIFTHFTEFMEKFRDTESHMEMGHLGLDPDTSTISYYLLESLPANLGIPITAAALLSAVYLVRTERKKSYLLLLIPVLYCVMLAAWKMRADRYILPVVPFLLMIAAVGLARLGGSLTLRMKSRRNTTGPLRGSLLRYGTGILVFLLLIPSIRAVTRYQLVQGLPDTRTRAMEWIEKNMKPGSAIATGPFGIELSTTKYITLPIQFTAVRSEQMTPFYNPEWYEDIDLVVMSDFDYGRYRLEPGRFRDILGYLDTLRTKWNRIWSIEPGDSLTGPALWFYHYPGETDDHRFPSPLFDQLLSSDMETGRKVAFLGKLGLILSLQGKLARSEQLFRTLLTLEPENETAKKALGDILTFRASPGKPVTGATGGRNETPEPDNDLVRAGDSLYALGRLDEAEQAYRSALAGDRRLVNAYLGLTMIYASRNDREGVILTLKNLLSILPPGSEDYARVLWELKSIERDSL